MRRRLVADIFRTGRATRWDRALLHESNLRNLLGLLVIREGATWRVESNTATPGRPAYRTLTLRGGHAGAQKGSYATMPAGSIIVVRSA